MAFTIEKFGQERSAICSLGYFTLFDNSFLKIKTRSKYMLQYILKGFIKQNKIKLKSFIENEGTMHFAVIVSVSVSSPVSILFIY